MRILALEARGVRNLEPLSLEPAPPVSSIAPIDAALEEIVARALAPANRRLPVSASHNTTPIENTSLHWLAPSPRTYSGAM